MTHRKAGPLATVLAAVMFVYLLAPIIMIFPLSFSNDLILKFPPDSWGVDWYRALLSDAGIRDAFATSLWLAVVVTVLSVLIGLPAAFAIVRIPFWGAGFLYNLLTTPLLLPTIVIGLALLIVFASFGMFDTFQALVLGHLVLVLPISLRMFATALEGVPPALEEAAATLGAAPLRVFRHVTLPLIAPATMAVAALSFLTSFDEAVVSLFLTGPSLKTLPVTLFHYVERRADPLVACASVFLIVLSFLVVLVIARTRGLTKSFVH